MTTTPDSRIARDFGVAETVEIDPNLRPPEYSGSRRWVSREEAADMFPPAKPIDTSTTATPDTSTTAGKIAVMQHAETHGASSIECRKKSSYCPGRYSRLTCDTPDILWNWEFFDYRIAPPPAPRTALQRARACQAGMTVVNSESPDGILCCLLTDIDYAPVVEVLERRISWDAADLSALPKGRYRLLRDDA